MPRWRCGSASTRSTPDLPTRRPSMSKRDPQHQERPAHLKQAQPYLSEVPKASPELESAVQAIADAPDSQPTPATDAPPAKSNSQLEAERNITRRLMEAALQEVRHLPRVWDQHPEDEQDEVIHRVRKAANE